jgi:hypothetical protein
MDIEECTLMLREPFATKWVFLMILGYIGIFFHEELLLRKVK